jgi:hypothetical protein
VDYVSEEAAIAGEAAVRFLRGESSKGISVSVKTDGKVRYTVPQILTEAKDTRLYFRVADVFRGKKIVLKAGDRVLLEKKTVKLAPGEMETVTVKAEWLSELAEGEISISLAD